MDPSQSATDKIISLWAVQVHKVATSQENVDLRVNKLEELINAMHTLTASKHCLADAQFRYTLLLESLAWDILSLLKLYQGMFALEDRVDHERPPKHLVTVCVDNAISLDIQNESFKSLLLNLINVWSKKEQLEYTALAAEIELFGKNLSGSEKDEFDRYRMILGPQLIVLPE